MSWMNACYSRLLIDNHISDLKPEYMRCFDPVRYAEAAATAGAEAAMVYACDHNGNCYYPTRIGHMHANLAGRDIFGETIQELDRRKIVPLAYYTVIFHNDAARRLPESRMQAFDGADHDGRYHYVCPNRPEGVEFFRNQLGEILDYPAIRGMFIDMTFWPLVCCCDGCRKRYRASTGEEIPAVIDWRDPAWLRFQRFRERSMAEFAQTLTDFVRARRSEISVTHQFSPVLHGWYLAQSAGIARASDYASGDFYGGRDQQRFGLEVFQAYSTRTPFEFMTSRCVSLHDHTSTKSDEELYLHALTTLLHGGAYLFIDAIDPAGTLCDDFYRKLGAINRRLTPFRDAIRRNAPRNRAAIGLLYSLESCVEPTLSGVALDQLRQSGSNMVNRTNPVRDEALGFASLLAATRRPYRVIRPDSADWDGLRAILLPNQAYLTPECCERLRRFVAAGGVLIATGDTSRFTPEGGGDGNFQLADVFGADVDGSYTDTVSYLASDVFPQPVFVAGAAPLVKARDSAEVKGVVNFPDFPVNDPERYASIHSNPPGRDTDYAGWIEHRFGAGRCVYCYAALAAQDQESQRAAVRKILDGLLPDPVLENREVSAALEVTELQSPDGDTLLFGVVNCPRELPAAPLRDLRFAWPLPRDFRPGRLRRISDGAEIEFQLEGGRMRWSLPELLHGELFACTKGEK